MALRPPFDIKKLEEFTKGDPETEKEVFSAFLDSSRHQLDILRQFVRGQGSNKSWENAAHQLRGAAAQLGVRRLADLCEEAETKSDSLTMNHKRALLERIENSFTELHSFIEDRFIR